MIEWIINNKEWLFSGVGVGMTMLITLVTSSLLFRKAKDEIEHKKSPHTIEMSASTDLDNLANLLVKNFQILTSFYSENLSQYRTSSIASISISVLGFIVIIAGLMIAFFTEALAVGTISSAAGIVAQAASMLFYKQNKAFQVQMHDSLNRLVSSQYMMTTIALARDLDGEGKNDEIAKINDHLRSLMDILHSKHNLHNYKAESGSRGFFSPSPHNTQQAGPHCAFHLNYRTLVG